VANPYVETTLRETLAFVYGSAARRTQPLHLAITILGGNDFYSQREEVRLRWGASRGGLEPDCFERSTPNAIRGQLQRRGLPPTAASLRTLPPYVVPKGATLAAVRKTGLGSSAALITSLVGALLAHLHVVQTSLSRCDAGRRPVLPSSARCSPGYWNGCGFVAEAESTPTWCTTSLSSATASRRARSAAGLTCRPPCMAATSTAVSRPRSSTPS